MNGEKALWTIAETAKAFRVPVFFVRAMIQRGEVPVFKSGTRTYILPEKFKEFLSKGGEPHEAKQLKSK